LSTQDRILWPFFLHSSSMFSCGLNRYVESKRSES
jgi:hypothetical protein